MCTGGLRKCDDNLQCIESNLICDGRDDTGCSDGSDEAHCKDYECLPNFWKCADNLQCVEAKFVCDGRKWFGPGRGATIYGCRDFSDEHNRLCGCREIRHWPCKNGDGCIDKSTVCNGKGDCQDRSDESENVCKFWNCTGGKWKCLNSFTCIEWHQICDGKPHCKDLSDEAEDMCLSFKCADRWIKCADQMQCILKNHICDDKAHCSDGSDEMCTASCLQHTLYQPNIVKRCSGQSELCFPIGKYCDGVADCPDGSDEADSECQCDDWGLITCKMGMALLCTPSQWINIHDMHSEGEVFCDESGLSGTKMEVTTSKIKKQPGK